LGKGLEKIEERKNERKRKGFEFFGLPIIPLFHHSTFPVYSIIPSFQFSNIPFF